MRWLARLVLQLPGPPHAALARQARPQLRRLAPQARLLALLVPHARLALLAHLLSLPQALLALQLPGAPRAVLAQQVRLLVPQPRMQQARLALAPL